MMSWGITAAAQTHSLAEEQTHTVFFFVLFFFVRFPEIDMTSILGSHPAPFLKEAAVRERGSVLLPYRPNFRCHFEKAMNVPLMSVCFSADIKKSLNKYTCFYVS